MTKTFVTGHRGFLGTHFLERLRGSSYLFNRETPVESVSRYQPHFIYHLAGEIYKDEQMLESNIILTYNLLNEARKVKNLKAFIYIGSSSEYGRKDHPMSEVDYLNPTNMYEATKGSASLLCQAFARQYNLPVMVARPFSLYGKYEADRRFIPTIITSIRKRKKLSISPGTHDYIHVDDFIDGLTMLAKNPQPGEVFNFGTGVQTTNAQLVELIEKIMRRKAKKTYIDKLHNYDSDCWVADSSKAKALGWKPRYDLKSGLNQVIKDTTNESKTFFGRKMK